MNAKLDRKPKNSGAMKLRRFFERLLKLGLLSRRNMVIVLELIYLNIVVSVSEPCDVIRVTIHSLPFCQNSTCHSHFKRILVSKIEHLDIVWTVNPLTAKLFNLNFHPPEVVSRWRDPQLQVSENYSDLTKWRLTVFEYCWLMSHFIFNMFKGWYIMC